ncbi:MAG: metal-dependent hydrolase [bacterium]|nr:metal-dependent hydrolase [bacterium]
MNAAGHLIGGLAAATLVEGVALGSGYLPPLTQEVQAAHWALPLTALMMSLFPDLDVASLPQRWYYRAALLALLWLHFTGRDLAFVLLALFSILPLVHRHRGWTHAVWAPFAVASLLALATEYRRAETGWWASFSWTDAGALWVEYLPYVAAAWVGHGVHLLLDSSKLRLVKGAHH